MDDDFTDNGENILARIASYTDNMPTMLVEFGIKFQAGRLIFVLVVTD